MLMAGLDGIKHKIDPGQPLDKDIFELDAEEAASIPSMPGSLDEALAELSKDHKFLTEGGVFTEDYVELWINYKKKNEADAVRMRPHPYEFHLYYDI
jgi:glutamine synthetase